MKMNYYKVFTVVILVVSVSCVLIYSPKDVSSQEVNPNQETLTAQPQDAQEVKEEKPQETQETMVAKAQEDDKFSLDLKGIDIIEFFKILSSKTGLNIVPSKEVKGRVTLYLNDVTFEDVFDIILVSNGLASERKGNVINVVTEEEYEKLYGESYNEKRLVQTFKLEFAEPDAVFSAVKELKSTIGKIVVDSASATVIAMDTPEKLELIQSAIKEIDVPTQTLAFALKYATAKDIDAQISKVITKGVGQINIDERSNKVIITDLPKKLDKIRSMIAELDEQEQQVLIDAKIIQITLNDTFESGIDWERLFSAANLHSLKLEGAFSPATSLAKEGKISIGSVSSDDYTLAFELLQTLGRTEVLSSPRIVVLNNQEASILVGTREAYVTQTQSQAESTNVTAENVEFIDVGVKLHVVPVINREGDITMKIKPEVSSTKTPLITALGSKIPIVETSEAQTTLRIKDGNTIILGGLMKKEDNKTSYQLPFFGSIPFLGSLFKSRSDEKKKTELAIFITPRIIPPSFTLKEDISSAEDVKSQYQKEREKTQQSLKKPLKSF